MQLTWEQKVESRYQQIELLNEMLAWRASYTGYCQSIATPFVLRKQQLLSVWEQHVELVRTRRVMAVAAVSE